MSLQSPSLSLSILKLLAKVKRFFASAGNGTAEVVVNLAPAAEVALAA